MSIVTGQSCSSLPLSLHFSAENGNTIWLYRYSLHTHTHAKLQANWISCTASTKCRRRDVVALPLLPRFSTHPEPHDPALSTDCRHMCTQEPFYQHAFHERPDHPARYDTRRRQTRLQMLQARPMLPFPRNLITSTRQSRPYGTSWQLSFRRPS